MAPVPRFELRRNRLTRRWRFNLVAANGWVIASSQRYRSKQKAIQGIKSVQANAAEATIVTVP